MMATLSSIAVGNATGETRVTDYIVGENWSADGLCVTATYDDATTADVTEYCSFTLTRGEESVAADSVRLLSTDVSVGVSYTETVEVGGEDVDTTVTTTDAITVGYLSSISSANRTGESFENKYCVGEYANVDALEITATFSNALTRVVTEDCEWTVTRSGVDYALPETALALGDSLLECSYWAPNDDSISGVAGATGITKTTTKTVHVGVFTSAEVTTPPTKVVYDEGEVFDATGMVVTGTFTKLDTNTFTKPITSYCSGYNRALNYGQPYVRFYADVVDVRAYVEQSVTVNLFPRTRSEALFNKMLEVLNQIAENTTPAD